MISGMAPSSLVADTSRVSEGAMFRQLTTLLAFASKMAEVESSLDFRPYAATWEGRSSSGGEFCASGADDGGSETARCQDSWRTAESMSRKDGEALERCQGRIVQPAARPCWTRAAYQSKIRS